MEEVWIRAYKGCLENVNQYVKDAIILKDRRSYGHAFALAVIGQEELSKSLVYFLIGLLQEAGKKELSEKLRKELHSLGAHERKIELGLLTPLMGKAIRESTHEVEKELPSLKIRKRAGESAEELTREVLNHYALPKIEQIAEKGEHAKRRSRTGQKLKKKGLYVDVSSDGKVVTGPFEITEKEVGEELDRLKENRRVAGEYIQQVLKYPQQIRSKMVLMQLGRSRA